jgi:hypothetical protein
MRELTLKEAYKIIYGISKPSKMPGYGWSIPPHRCITGSKLRKVSGTGCAICYAWKGRYSFKEAQYAMARRFQSFKGKRWVDAMVVVLGSDRVRKRKYFRWFDSGDLQSVVHLSNICEICRRTPWLKHWMPTKEKKFVLEYVKQGGKIPDNLIIRASAIFVNGKHPEWWPWTSGIHHPYKSLFALGKACTAKERDGKCGNCRACWDKAVPATSYPAH